MRRRLGVWARTVEGQMMRVDALLLLLAIVLVAPAPRVRAATVGSPVTIAGVTALTGIACPSADVCYAVGSTGYTTLAKGVVVTLTDGSAGNPTVVAGTNELDGIACATTELCYLVGIVGSRSTTPGSSEGVLVPLTNGEAGAVQTVDGAAELAGVACTTPDTCYAVGGTADALSSQGAVVPVTNGQAGPVQTIDGTFGLGPITCPTSDTCYVAGSSLPTPGYPETAIVMLTDGIPGSPQTEMLTDVPLGIACATSELCFAATGGTDNSGYSIAVVVPIVNGVLGDPQTLPKPQGGFLTSIVCPTNDTCYGFGYGPYQRQLTAIFMPLAVGDAGAASIQQMGDPEDLENVDSLSSAACPTSDTCYAVGVTTTHDGVVGTVVPVTVAGG